jgi:hypothetical protein
MKRGAIMGMIIRFESGLRVEAILLAANADGMRIVVFEGNTLELVRMGDSWHTESGAAIQIEGLVAIPGIDVAQVCAGVRLQALAAGSSCSAF